MLWRHEHLKRRTIQGHGSIEIISTYGISKNLQKTRQTQTTTCKKKIRTYDFEVSCPFMCDMALKVTAFNNSSNHLFSFHTSQKASNRVLLFFTQFLWPCCCFSAALCLYLYIFKAGLQSSGSRIVCYIGCNLNHLLKIQFIRMFLRNTLDYFALHCFRDVPKTYFGPASRADVPCVRVYSSAPVAVLCFWPCQPWSNSLFNIF